MIRCVVCNHVLKDPESQDRGVGAICEKKLDRETLIEIREIIHKGYQPRLVGESVIQMQIPEASDEWPSNIETLQEEKDNAKNLPYQSSGGKN